MTDAKSLTVFYDGACPLCEREIKFYRRRRGAEALNWIDVSDAGDGEVAPGLPREQAMARFHVRDGSGKVLSGGEAFARLWRELPGFRGAGKFFSLPPLAWALNRSYDYFLRFRPRLQRLVAAPCAAAEDALPRWLIRDLRSDHAGETGAVAIYRGILKVCRNPEVRCFAEAHLETERRHLALIEAVLPRDRYSRLLPLWRVAGLVTGALPAVFGPRAVYGTIAAVETFVDHHYGEQIARLDRSGTQQDIRAMLEQCRLDEVQHRDEAKEALQTAPGPLLKLWCRAVGLGSAMAVTLARRV